MHKEPDTSFTTGSLNFIKQASERLNNRTFRRAISIDRNGVTLNSEYDLGIHSVQNEVYCLLHSRKEFPDTETVLLYSISL